MKVTPISAPLPGEHLAAVHPVMRPDTDDAGWCSRLNFWTGRALTEQALDTEQENRAARLAWRGRLVSPGVVTGLDVALESPAATNPPQDPTKRSLNGYYLHLAPGHGIAVTGEDVVIPRPLRLNLDLIPTVYARADGAAAPPAEAPSATVAPAPVKGKLRFTPLDLGSGWVRWHQFNPRYVPWAAVLVLRPVQFIDIAGRDPASPCPLDDSFDAFDDPRRVDATQVMLCLLPPTWQRDELLLHQGQEPTWRNRVASLIARKEMERAARQDVLYRVSQPADRRWAVAPSEGDLFPWEYFGVPIALLGWEPVPGAAAPAPQRLFLDRAAVARPGGVARPRPRPAIRLSDAAEKPSDAGFPAVWQARVVQFNEHLRDLLRDNAFLLAPDATDATVAAMMQALAARFRYLPPAGLLPRAAMHFLTTAEANTLHQTDRADTSVFFPPSFGTRAVPVTEAEMNTLLAASAPLARFDTAVPEPVCVLVPLPEARFDPNLLVVEQPDPAFQAEVDRLYCLRQDWRQRRDCVWVFQGNLLQMLGGDAAVAGRQLPTAGQLEPEPTETDRLARRFYSLVPPADNPGPWSIEITLSSAVSLATWVTLGLQLHLDEEYPAPRVEIRWLTTAGEASDTWETPPVLVVPPPLNGAPQAASLWHRYERPLADIGLDSASSLTGLVVTFTGARAALLAICGTHSGSAAPQGLWAPGIAPDTIVGRPSAWTEVRNNNAPFEDAYAPALPDGSSFDTAFTQFDNDTQHTVDTDGLEQVVTDFTAEADRADDAVNLAFDRTRAQLHTIRQVLLGEQAADALLASPSVGGNIATKPGLAVAKDVQNLFPKKVTGPEVPAEKMMAVPAAPAPPEPPAAGSANDTRLLNLTRSTLAPAAFELRTLNIPRRFDAGVTLEAYQTSHSALSDTLGVVGRQPLDFDSTVVPDVRVHSAAGGDTTLTFADLKKKYVEIDASADPKRAEASFLTTLVVDNGNETFFKATGAKSFQLAGTSGQVLAIGVRRNDQIIAILRHVETFITRKRQLIARGQMLLDAVRAQAGAASSRLLVLEGRLAEARHDMAVARALWQEELDRVAALNAHRDDLLANSVRHLGYVRPRCIDLVRRDLPSTECLSGALLAPVPAALQSNIEPPDELDGYLGLFRQAPVRWFNALAPRLVEIDTIDRVTRLLDSAQENARRFLAVAPPAFRVGAEAGAATYRASFSLIEPLRRNTVALAAAPPNRSWDDWRRTAVDHATVGDLIDDAHGRHELARTAAQELENIGKVAAFLYNEFAAVRPGLRMQWVERYSQFDHPAPLRDITTLPGADTLTLDSRRRFQAYIDWLFGRVVPAEAGASSLINDLVRLCLLLASHAPVNQLILGHVPRPVPVRPGVLVPVRLLDPRLVRVGMEFQVWRDSRIVARGQVEDLRDGEAAARVSAVDADVTSLDVNMRVQFQNAISGAATRTLSLAGG